MNHLVFYIQILVLGIPTAYHNNLLTNAFQNRKQYLIKWLGYSSNENTWQDENDILDKELLKNFETAYRQKSLKTKHK